MVSYSLLLELIRHSHILHFIKFIEYFIENYYIFDQFANSFCNILDIIYFY